MVAAILLLAGVTTGQGTFELEFEAFGEQDGVLAGEGNQWVPTLPEKPESCKRVPTSPGKNATFLQADIAGGPVLVVAATLKIFNEHGDEIASARWSTAEAGAASTRSEHQTISRAGSELSFPELRPVRARTTGRVAHG
ncbi:MAG: hypothetical protein JW889_15040 [Verrucomicrobia bacterium]|nr:hypothetical protein [Verrucomicrobiota bacterium]